MHFDPSIDYMPTSDGLFQFALARRQDVESRRLGERGVTSKVVLVQDSITPCMLCHLYNASDFDSFSSDVTVDVADWLTSKYNILVGFSHLFAKYYIIILRFS